MVQGIERRMAPRAPIGTKIKWQIHGTSEWYEDSSQNVSSTGMMIRTEESVEPGSTITLSFKIPNLKFQEPIIVEAEVAREVQRHNRQIGLGLKFLTLQSRNYLVVEEFVHRILDLPRDEILKKLGRQDSSGYSFDMEQLIREAESRKAEDLEKKLAEKERQRRKASIKQWSVRGIKTGLCLLGLFFMAKVVCFFLNLANCIQGVQ